MSEGDFTLNKSGWYTALKVAENDFLNDKLENEDYGIYYSVRFEGDAETYLWQAKTAPVVGEKYYGHIENSKSGKSLRFKKDKLPEGEDSPAEASPSQKPSYQDNSKNITLGLVWKTIAGIRGLPEDDADFAKFYEIVNAHFTELILMQEKLK